jgi:hypothetical protein
MGFALGMVLAWCVIGEKFMPCTKVVRSSYCATLCKNRANNWLHITFTLCKNRANFARHTHTGYCFTWNIPRHTLCHIMAWGEIAPTYCLIPPHIFVPLLDQMLHSKPEHVQKIVLNTTCGDCGGHVMKTPSSVCTLHTEVRVCYMKGGV